VSAFSEWQHIEQLHPVMKPGQHGNGQGCSSGSERTNCSMPLPLQSEMGTKIVISFIIHHWELDALLLIPPQPTFASL